MPKWSSYGGIILAKGQFWSLLYFLNYAYLWYLAQSQIWCTTLYLLLLPPGLPPDLKNWMYNLVLPLPGLTTWSYHLVLPPDLTTWSYHLVLPPGLITWSYHLVLPPGLVPWSYSQYFWVNYEKIKNMFWRLMFTGDIQKTIWFFLRILFYDF